MEGNAEPPVSAARLRAAGVVAAARAVPPDLAADLARALLSGGVAAVEFSGPGAAEAGRRAAAEAPGALVVAPGDTRVADCGPSASDLAAKLADPRVAACRAGWIAPPELVAARDWAAVAGRAARAAEIAHAVRF